jgi:hypothetical protein
MNRPLSTRAAVALAAALGLVPPSALAQATPPPPKPTGPTAAAPAKGKPAPKSQAPGETRFRLVFDFASVPGSTSYGDVRTSTVYAEASQTTTSYTAGTGLGGAVALQVSLYRGLGFLVGYSHISRDTIGTLDVDRPHPLYLNRPRDTSGDLSGGSYSEGAFDLDAAYARTVGALDWALFGGVTFFNVQAGLLDVPTFGEAYPYNSFTIQSTPSRDIKESATGFNVGGRLDYRFGEQKRFGAGVTLRYSNASVQLTGTQASTPATVDAGGFSIGGGLRVYF